MLRSRKRCGAVGLLLLIAVGGTCCTGPGQGASGPAASGEAGAPRTVRVRVEVVGNKRPLESIQVELYRDHFEPIPGDLLEQAVTNKDGIADLNVAPGTYGLWLRALNLGSQWRYTGPTRFTLTKDRTLRLEMKPAH